MDWLELVIAGAVGYVVGKGQADKVWRARLREQARVADQVIRDRERDILDQVGRTRTPDEGA